MNPSPIPNRNLKDKCCVSVVQIITTRYLLMIKMVMENLAEVYHNVPLYSLSLIVSIVLHFEIFLPLQRIEIAVPFRDEL